MVKRGRWLTQTFLTVLWALAMLAGTAQLVKAEEPCLPGNPFFCVLKDCGFLCIEGPGFCDFETHCCICSEI